MLFSYDNPTSQAPYYKSIEEMPGYQKEQKVENREKIIGGTFGALFQAAASMVPVVGGAIGKAGAGGINKSLENRHNDANAYFTDELSHQMPQTNSTGSLSSLSGGLQGITQNKGLMQYLQNEMQKNKDNAFTQQALTDGLNSTSQFDKFVPASENTPAAPNINPSQQIDLNSTGGSSNFDFSSFGGGGGDFAAPAMGFYRGGLAPLGKDDIALVDTKNGEDTGIRLQAGEMLVVSRKTLSSLNKALSDGDHKEVYDLMKAQVKVAPKVKDGMKGHVDGGKADTNTADYTYDGQPLQLGVKPKTYKDLIARYNLLKKVIDDSGDPENFKPTRQTNNTEAYTESMQKLPATLDKLKDEYKNIEALYNKVEAKHGTGLGLDVNANSDIEPELLEDKANTAYKADGPEVDIVAPKKETKPSESDAFPDGVPEITPVGAEGALKPKEDNTIDTIATAGQATSVTPEAQTGPSGADYAKFFAPQALGTGFDIARGALGFNAANKPLPTFTKPEAWNSYVNRLHGLSETGLTANEMTAATRGIDQTYAYDVDNIRNLSGGNAGMALGNLGRAAGQHYAAQTNLAALNDEARARNLGQYGQALGEDVNLDRMIYGDKFNIAMANKQAGGQLAHDAISNIQQRGQYMQEYAPGSYYDQINQQNLQSAKDTNANTKQMQQYYATHGVTSPTITSTTPAATPSATDNTVPAGYAQYLRLKEQYPDIFKD